MHTKLSSIALRCCIEVTVQIMSPTPEDPEYSIMLHSKDTHTFQAAGRSVHVPEYSNKHVMAILFGSFVGRMAQRKVMFNS
jgi:hypothetical protein